MYSTNNDFWFMRWLTRGEQTSIENAPLIEHQTFPRGLAFDSIQQMED